MPNLSHKQIVKRMNDEENLNANGLLQLKQTIKLANKVAPQHIYAFIHQGETILLLGEEIPLTGGNNITVGGRHPLTGERIIIVGGRNPLTGGSLPPTN